MFTQHSHVPPLQQLWYPAPQATVHPLCVQLVEPGPPAPPPCVHQPQFEACTASPFAANKLTGWLRMQEDSETGR